MPDDVTTPVPPPAPDVQDTSAPPLTPTSQPQPPAAPPIATGPAQAPASAGVNSPSPGGVLGAIAVGSLKAVAQHLSSGAKTAASTVGRGFSNLSRNSPYGQELQKNELGRQAARQELQLKQNQEARAQQEEQRKEQQFPQEMEEQRVRTNYLSTQAAGQALKNSLDQSKLPLEQQEIEQQKNAADAELIEDAEGQGYTFNKEHGTSFDNLGQQPVKDIVSGTVFAINNGQTGSNHGIVLGSVPEAKQSPLLHDQKVIAGWDMDPDKATLTPRYQTLAAGNNTIMDMVNAHYNETREFNEKAAQVKSILDNKEAATKAANEPAEEQQKLAKGTEDIHDLQAKTNLTNLQARQFGDDKTPNIFGDTDFNPADPSLPLAPKDKAAAWKSFDEKVLIPLQTSTQKSYQMTQQAFSEYKKANGKLPTGAQGMLLLSQHLATTFGNVKGSRVTRDMIQEHLGARGLTDNAVTAVQRLTNGDPLSPAQWDAFTHLIGQSYLDSYTAAIDNARSSGIGKAVPSFLPHAPAKGTHIDTPTAKIYMYAAQGDAEKASAAAAQNGWSF